MYPRNAASPPSVLIGEVVQISDGAVQTTGVSVRVKTGSGAWGAGAGTLACDTTSGVWEYTPTQAETNGDTIKIAIYKSACLGASATLVTTAEATAGTVKLGAAQTTNITGSLSGSVGSVTGNVGGSVASVTGNVGGNVVGSVASVTAGVTLANTAHGGAAATLTLQTLTVSNSAGNAVVFESTGGSGHGLCATGEGGGSGIVAIGGSTGKGLFAEGGATTGHGAYFRAHGADSYGALFLGGASGAAGAFFDSSSAGPGIAADITGDLTGNVSGSVGSVTGNVGGSVVGSVGSVTGGINTGAGTITTLDALDTAQDTQHATTQSAISGLNDPTAAAIADAVWDEATSGHATAGTTGKALTDVLADTNELQTNQGNWLTATGFSTHSAADVWSVATRVLTAATNITSDGSAITMSSAGVVGTVNLVNTTTTNTDMRGTDSAYTGTPPSVADIADGVWDEPLSGHSTAGTAGKALSDAGSAGDPWSTALPGAYGAGTAGFLVGTYIDAAISDTATAASVAALNDLSTADIDARLAAYDPPTNAEMVAAFTEIKGATWSSATDTLEALRDRGDAAWITATGFSTLDAAEVRTAIGLASANLDTQLADIPTVAEFNARTLAAADYFDPAADTVANVTTVGTVNALAANSITSTVLATDCITSGKIATDAIGASELSAAAINAIQSGLATAANQTTILANQATIADYIDTEVGSIKAVTDKLDTTLVQDGAVYDFTAAALAAAPSGGGGGGDATAANQTTIIAHLTDIKGATWDSSNSLEAVSDAIAALDVGSGGGPKAVTITVTDGTDPLDTARVSVYLSGVLKATGSTNASGQFVANVASSGTFDVVATFDGHYQASAVTFNAATDSTAAVALTALSITPAPSGYTTGWLYSYDENGDIEASISYRYRPVSPNAAATGESLSPDWNTVTSDVNGKVEFPKMRLGVTYEYQRVGNERQVGKFKVPTTAGATTPLPQII